jgi:hypothetical protein
VLSTVGVGPFTGLECAAIDQAWPVGCQKSSLGR